MKQLIFLTYEKRELKQWNNKKGYDIAAIAWISDVKLYLHLIV